MVRHGKKVWAAVLFCEMVCWQENQVVGGLVKFPVQNEGKHSEIQTAFVRVLAASRDCCCCYKLFRLFKYNEKGQSPVTFRWLNAKWFCFLDRFQHCLWTPTLECGSGFIVFCWLIGIWLQAGNYQIRSQPKIKIPVSLLCACADRHSDRDRVCLYGIKDNLEFEELNCEAVAFNIWKITKQRTAVR